MTSPRVTGTVYHMEFIRASKGVIAFDDAFNVMIINEQGYFN